MVSCERDDGHSNCLRAAGAPIVEGEYKARHPFPELNYEMKTSMHYSLHTEQTGMRPKKPGEKNRGCMLNNKTSRGRNQKGYESLLTLIYSLEAE